MIPKSEAERALGVSSTTFYSYVKKLKIQLLTKVDSKGKSSYINPQDLEKMAQAMGKVIESTNSQSKQGSDEHQSNPQEEFKENEIVKENFNLQLKVKEQEEVIKSSNELLSLYKEQNNHLQTQQQQAQSQVNHLYLQIIQTTNKATAYGISAIALLVILILVVTLAVL
ncbi:hypothetical protein [Flavobacterium sp.]|uniref:hypothetical protein n=1 Tax=Flavobacterium sp. TaxID=239 RepID=UPI002630B698|nr:hypothetical protein [Flavobacterium sp.]